MVVNVGPRIKFLQREAARSRLETQRKLVVLEKGMQYHQSRVSETRRYASHLLKIAERDFPEKRQDSDLKANPSVMKDLKSKVRKLERGVEVVVFKSQQAVRVLRDFDTKLDTLMKENLTTKSDPVKMPPILRDILVEEAHLDDWTHWIQWEFYSKIKWSAKTPSEHYLLERETDAYLKEVKKALGRYETLLQRCSDFYKVVLKETERCFSPPRVKKAASEI